MADEIRVNYPDPKFCTKTSWLQFGYGLWGNLSMVNVGLAYGFSSVAIPQLQAANSTIKLTVDEVSWIASVVLLSSPVGCIFSGYLMDKIGRKYTLLLCELPYIAGWMYFLFAGNALEMIAGRVITGIGVGMTVPPSRVYVTEISLPNMRGVIGAFNTLAISVGLIIQSALGSFFHWKILCYVAIGYSVALCLINFSLPESPYYLLERGHMEALRKALSRLRAKEYDVETEIEEMREFRDNNSIQSISFCKRIKALFKDSVCKPFAIIMTYVVIAQFSGVTIILFWSLDIINAVNTTVDQHIANVMLSVSRFVGGILCSILLYTKGRRCLTITSGLGLGLTCFALATYIQVMNTPTIFPTTGLILYILFGSIGFYSIPMLMMTELYPLQVRSLLGGITISLANIAMFCSNKAYPFVVNAIGHVAIIFLFGSAALLGTLLLFFILPETKGLTLQEIEEYFNKLRPSLVSQRELLSLHRIKSRSRSELDRMFSNTSRTRGITLELLERKKKEDQLSLKSNKSNKSGMDDKKIKKIPSDSTSIPSSILFINDTPKKKG